MISRRLILAGIGSAASLASLPACSFAAPLPQARTTKDAFAILETLAQRLVESGDVAGIAAGMTGRGFRKSAYFGMADIEGGVEISPDTEFRIASITKTFVAAAALQLEEAGKLSLDARVSEFFPKFPMGDKITLTQLLQHTSGLANWWDRMPPDAPDDFMNRPDAVEWLARMNDPFLFPPGTMRSYSNSGFVLLGKILEQAGNGDLDSVLANYVFTRVGAGQTAFEDLNRPDPKWAVGYRSSFTGLSPDPVLPPPFAAGGIRSTLHDQLAFGDALFLGQMLDPKSRVKMLEHARVADGRRVQDVTYVAPRAQAEEWPIDTSEMGYGLGINTWVQAGERFYSHAGLIDGFGSYFLHAPRKGITVSLLSNTFDGTSSLHEQVRRLLIGMP